MRHSVRRILILGCGYVGEKLARACLAEGLQVYATTRHQRRALALEKLGITSYCVDSPVDLTDELLASVDAILDSIPLHRDAHGVHAMQSTWLPKLSLKCPNLIWAGYLSTTGVYGDANGAWVDESWPCQPSSARGRQRLLAEQAWLMSSLPAEVFRLAGIYGPERNIFERLKAGDYQAVVWQPAHYSSRIHVDDIVAALMAAMQSPKAGRIVNVADDMPLPHADYVCEVASMIAAPQPVLLSEEEGRDQLSAAALSFFQDNKRVSNHLLHQELLAELKYPDFRHGIGSIMASRDG
ncbi:MAG: SDR family oxidoreductase [Mariprofundus sp.]|nr:SDR family oxidoreductase [Mariprofundus sp.]